MKIKLWKDNKIDQEYEMEINDIIEGYLKSEFFERFNAYRYLSVYININLNSSFDPKDGEKLLDCYFKMKHEN